MYYRRKATYTQCRDGMMFVRPAGKDKLIRLSGTARRIWELLEYPESVDEASKMLAAKYSASPEIITRETATFIVSLNQSGLLEESDAAPSSCRQAVDEYRKEHIIAEPLQYVNPSCVFWRKQI